MAFHFNWSPLIADTDRVRHMLTSSLNKSPKPPIIVDDIFVNELNLGSTPPSLEILEIGDLAEDRFRGIFKVKYEGDAYLTLQTRVQANPLNTFLSTKPSFASPTPLAASSGLTIPLQITLSDIRLSGFVILVFSKQKGITLVFRNDPLESLKVSSTFDSIPFVREYLQRTIEAQLRVLFMEDLPAIIHRLSLRVFSEEHRPSSDGEKAAEAEKDKEAIMHTNHDRDATDDAHSVTSTIDSSSLLDASGEAYASFSQKNLVRLAALSESQRTLSLFTPNIRDAVYRAWTSAAERNAEGAASGLHSKSSLPTLSRINSAFNVQHSVSHSRVPGSAGTLSSAASHTSDAPSLATRPSLAAHSYTSTSYSLGSGRSRPHGTRKRKNRVVNLRRDRDGPTDGASETMSVGSSYEDSAGKSESMSASGEGHSSSGPELDSTVLTSSSIHKAGYEGEVHTPHSSPQKKVDFRRRPSIKEVEPLPDVIAGAERLEPRKHRRPVTPRNPQNQLGHPFDELDADPTPRQSMYLPEDPTHTKPSNPRRNLERQQTMPPQTQSSTTKQPPMPPSLPRSSSELSISDLLPSYPFTQDGKDGGSSSGGILEQAWMTKMATEIARRVAEERERQQDVHASRRAVGKGDHGEQVQDIESDAPPAYVG
ncbi:ERMES complex subunit [Saxophila tyrrhenica]|uniref:Mitochondrial distribution and morphology protein 34 n=1 Tax=Saxophila tyrrhenica TaxID=1690608 RepID=A0AAV9PAA2_9PEZI|nr:ERMES complex subunit [Saxophila tyrrhenica]